MTRLLTPHAEPANGASAATPSGLTWVPASQPSRGGPAGRAGAGSSRPESPGPTLARLPRRQRPRRMDDAKIPPSHQTRIEVLRLDGDGGGVTASHSRPPIGEQRDRSDLLDGDREWAGQPHPQHGMAFGDRQPHPVLAGTRTCRGSTGSGRAGACDVGTRPAPSAAALGGLEPGIRIAAQDRAAPDRRQLSGGSSCGEFAAQRLIADDRRQSMLDPLRLVSSSHAQTSPAERSSP